MATRFRKNNLLIILILMPVIFAFTVGITAKVPQKDSFATGKVSADMALKNYERTNSMCAVLLMDILNGEIVYTYNRSAIIEKHYPPGSIAKPWSALALLQYRNKLAFDDNMSLICSGRHYPAGGIKFSDTDLKIFNLPADDDGKKYFRCSLRDGHGVIDLHSAIVRSCNNYFLTVASPEPEVFFRILSQTFSLEYRTNAILLKNIERPPPKDRHNGSPFRFAASAIGEGGLILCSPLKAAQIYAAIFAHGQIPTPFERPIIPPRSSKTLGFSAENINFVYETLKDVVTSGTLQKLPAIENIKVLAGKTGTATILGERYRTHGWNILHISHGSKQYVLVSFIERGSGPKEALVLSSITLNHAAAIIAEYDTANEPESL